MGLVRKKKFTIAALDLNDQTFIVYIAFLASSKLSLEIHPFYGA